MLLLADASRGTSAVWEVNLCLAFHESGEKDCDLLKEQIGAVLSFWNSRTSSTNGPSWIWTSNENSQSMWRNIKQTNKRFRRPTNTKQSFIRAALLLLRPPEEKRFNKFFNLLSILLLSLSLRFVLILHIDLLNSSHRTLCTTLLQNLLGNLLIRTKESNLLIAHTKEVNSAAVSNYH